MHSQVILKIPNAQNHAILAKTLEECDILSVAEVQELQETLTGDPCMTCSPRCGCWRAPLRVSDSTIQQPPAQTQGSLSEPTPSHFTHPRDPSDMFNTNMIRSNRVFSAWAAVGGVFGTPLPSCNPVACSVRTHSHPRRGIPSPTCYYVYSVHRQGSPRQG